jgi:hypothetical protein
MLGWSIKRQRLPLRLEAGEHGLGIHARLDELQRHLALDRRGLFGGPDGAHAPLADQFQKLVALRDHGPGLLVGK